MKSAAIMSEIQPCHHEHSSDDSPSCPRVGRRTNHIYLSPRIHRLGVKALWCLQIRRCTLRKVTSSSANISKHTACTTKAAPAVAALKTARRAVKQSFLMA
ncbi:hypothetical protein IG631_21976 [Alternaria alternata]|nr:hypothetical protein IG631_21976 [Alternaria alternata]